MTDEKKPGAAAPRSMTTEEIPTAGVMWAAIAKMAASTAAIERNVAGVPNIERNVDLMRGEVRTVVKRVEAVEQRVSVLEQEKCATAPMKPPRPRPSEAQLAEQRQQSEANLENKATLGAIISHHARVDGAMTELLENDSRQDEVLVAQDQVLGAHSRALVVIGRELGVAHKFDPLLTQSLPPPPEGLTHPKKPVLQLIDRRSRVGQIVQVVLALGVIADVIRSLVIHH